MAVQPRSNSLLSWVNSFDYPHCVETASFHELKSGIAICELIYDIILNKNTPQFLSQVVISHLDEKHSIGNLMLALDYVRRAAQSSLPSQVEQLSAQELYNDPSKMRVLLEYLKVCSATRSSFSGLNSSRQNLSSSLPKRPPLPRQLLQSRQSSKPESKHQCESAINGRTEQPSEFTSTSRLFNRPSTAGRKKQTSMDSSHEFIRSSKKAPCLEDESPIKFNINDPANNQTKTLLCKWLSDIHLLKLYDGIEKELPFVCKNGMLFVDLLNWLNGKDVVINCTAKHFSETQTVEATYKKVLKYLSGFERMNPRYLLSSTEMVDGDNEDLFWGLLDDIYHLHHNKISKYDRRYWRMDSSSQKTQVQQSLVKKVSQPLAFSGKQISSNLNRCSSKQRMSTKQLSTQDSQTRLKKENKENIQNKINSAMEQEQVQEIYSWVKQQGFSYSLDKALKLSQKESHLKNPLRNGTLIGSIIMRMQIARLNLIKQPTQDKHVVHNFEQINKNCIRRALGLTSINPPFSLTDILLFLHKLKLLNLQPRTINSKSRNIEEVSKIREISIDLKEWLDELGIIDVRREFSKIATSVIKVDVCKETTEKIRQSNIAKILTYLKKLGMVQYLPVTYQDVLNEECDVVWHLVEDIYNIKYNL